MHRAPFAGQSVHRGPAQDLDKRLTGLHPNWMYRARQATFTPAGARHAQVQVDGAVDRLDDVEHRHLAGWANSNPPPPPRHEVISPCATIRCKTFERKLSVASLSSTSSLFCNLEPGGRLARCTMTRTA